MPRLFPLLVPFATSAVIALGPSLGRAQSSSSVAEALFNDGRTLFDRGRFDEACPKFQESDRLEPAAGTKLNLAMCEESRGRIATAWALFRVVTELLAPSDPRTALAVQHRESLQARVPKVTIVLKASAPSDTTVVVDGVSLERASFGTELPVDPGTHQIKVSASGRKEALSSFEALEGKATVLEVEPGPVLAPAPPPPARAPEPTKPHPIAPPAAATAPSAFTPLRVAAAGVAGAGVVGLAISAVFAVNAMNENDKSFELGCQGNACRPDGKAARRRAISAADTATVFTVVGSALVAGGAVLWFVGAPDEPIRTGVRVRGDALEARLSVALR